MVFEYLDADVYFCPQVFFCELRTSRTDRGDVCTACTFYQSHAGGRENIDDVAHYSCFQQLCGSRLSSSLYPSIVRNTNVTSKSEAKWPL